jgi:hypothetical protein
MSNRQSIHKARELGAAAGLPQAFDLWWMSKRELIEAAIQIAAREVGHNGVPDPVAGIHRVGEEIKHLRAQKRI